MGAFSEQALLEDEQGFGSRTGFNRENGYSFSYPKSAKKKRTSGNGWTQCVPVPETAPALTDECIRQLAPNNYVYRGDKWEYRENGELHFVAVRYEHAHERDENSKPLKTLRPFTFFSSRQKPPHAEWRTAGSDKKPLPLYNVDGLKERPDAPVIVVEGEKKVHAAEKNSLTMLR